MHVIIDGYNLLRHLYPREKGKLDKQRAELIRTLGIYKQGTDNEVVLVFDGGLMGHATREVHRGVVVIFSGQRASADEWIIEYTRRHKGEDMLVVSRDRELVGKCSVFGAESLDVGLFYDVVQDRLIADATRDLEVRDADTVTPMGEIENEALDVLMRSTNIAHATKEDDDWQEQLRRRSGSERTLSKKQRKQREKLKKL